MFERSGRHPNWVMAALPQPPSLVTDEHGKQQLLLQPENGPLGPEARLRAAQGSSIPHTRASLRRSERPAVSVEPCVARYGWESGHGQGPARPRQRPWASQSQRSAPRDVAARRGGPPARGGLDARRPTGRNAGCVRAASGLGPSGASRRSRRRASHAGRVGPHPSIRRAPQPSRGISKLEVIPSAPRARDTPAAPP